MANMNVIGRGTNLPDKLSMLIRIRATRIIYWTISLKLSPRKTNNTMKRQSHRKVQETSISRLLATRDCPLLILEVSRQDDNLNAMSV